MQGDGIPASMPNENITRRPGRRAQDVRRRIVPRCPPFRTAARDLPWRVYPSTCVRKRRALSGENTPRGKVLLRGISVRMDKLASPDVLTEPWMAARCPPHCFINDHRSGFYRRTRRVGECDWLLIRTSSTELRSQHPCAIQAEARRFLSGSCIPASRGCYSDAGVLQITSCGTRTRAGGGLDPTEAIRAICCVARRRRRFRSQPSPVGVEE